MKLLRPKKKNLFDGDQENLFASIFKIGCKKCSNEIELNPLDLKQTTSLSNEILELSLKKISRLTKIDLGDIAFYKVNGLPLKWGELRCSECNTRYIGFFGVGEYQPTRFMLTNVLLVEL